MKPAGMFVVIMLAVVGMGSSRLAHADDRSAAEAAFLKAKDLMKDGKTAEACDAFEKSQTLDPQMGTQYNLALCWEKLGRLASAWGIFRELAQRDSNAARKKDSTKRAKDLDTKLTRMLINAEGPAPGISVTRNGDDVTAEVGIESPVDPGVYTIVASAPGRKSFTAEVNANGAGLTVTVKIPVLEEEAAVIEDPDVDGENPDVPPDDDIGVKLPPPSGGGKGRKIAGLSIAGGGVVLAGVGAFFGLSARSKWNDAKTLCGDDLACDSDGQLDEGNALVADARSAGTLSTVFIGVGAAAIVGGVILWLTAPDGGGGGEHALRLEPVVGDDTALVSLSGWF